MFSIRRWRPAPLRIRDRKGEASTCADADNEHILKKVKGILLPWGYQCVGGSPFHIRPHPPRSARIWRCHGSWISFVLMLSEQIPLSMVARTTTGTVRSLIPLRGKHRVSSDSTGIDSLSPPWGKWENQGHEGIWALPWRKGPRVSRIGISHRNQHMLSKTIR